MAALDASDWRREDEDFTVNLETNLALADALRPIAESRGVSVGAVAIAWTLAWPGVTAAIVGARSAAQVDGWIAAADLVLEPSDLDAVAGAIASTGAGRGPARP
jgi:aryl-alcohol dehydrogenase-like predicted oxidoreductase